MQTKEATTIKKILLVEDEPDLAATMQLRLEMQGYQVSLAADGQEALNRARAEMPDLIILDIMLPKMDGYKVCRMLKFDEKYRKIPVMMFSARAQEKDKQVAMECGADDYLVKPFEPNILFGKIKELLAKVESTNSEVVEHG